MFSEWTYIEICLVVTLTVNILESMRARFILFGFKSRWVQLEVHLAIPGKLTVMFGLMETIALDILGLLYSIRKDQVAPLLAILIL